MCCRYKKAFADAKKRRLSEAEARKEAQAAYKEAGAEWDAVPDVP